MRALLVLLLAAPLAFCSPKSAVFCIVNPMDPRCVQFCKSYPDLSACFKDVWPYQVCKHNNVDCVDPKDSIYCQRNPLAWGCYRLTAAEMDEQHEICLTRPAEPICPPKLPTNEEMLEKDRKAKEAHEKLQHWSF